MSEGTSWQAVFAALQQPRLRQVYAAAVLDVMLNRVRSSELDRLVRAGLLNATETGYQVNEGVFEQVLIAYQIQRACGANRYLRLNRLRALPVNGRERAAVLCQISDMLFEPGQHYSEREVNLLLRVLGGDVPRLRRSLIDAQLLERKRDGSGYWVPQGLVGGAEHSS